MNAKNQPEYAGFWRRFVAFFIDTVIVSIVVFPFALLVATLAPKALLVEVPLGLFTTSEITSQSKESVRNSDGSSSTVVIERKKEIVMGIWENHYRVTTTEREEGEDAERELVDPETGYRREIPTSGDLEFYAIFVYWILLEASRWQASVGKKLMGIKVVNEDGGRLSIGQSIFRNVAKILSGIILFVGFMMAGWTRRKQALHDKMSKSLVVLTDTRQLNRPLSEGEVSD